MDIAQIEQRFRGMDRRLALLEEMVDTERSIVTADILRVSDPVSPQIIRVSEEGGLDLGSEGIWRIVDGTLTEEVSHTGDTNETVLHTITVKGNSMGPNGILRIFASFWAIGVGMHTFTTYWDGTQFSRYNATNVKVTYDIPPKYIWNRGATNSQGSTMSRPVHANFGETIFGTAKDTTQDVDIDFRVQNSDAAATAYLRLALVEVFHGG